MNTQKERFVHPETLYAPMLACGQSRQRAARTGVLLPHAHAVVEVCLITRGGVRWWADDEVVEIPAGSLWITRPGERHGAMDGILQPCVLSWLQVDPARCAAAARLAAASWRTIPGAAGLLADFEAILAECRRPQADSAAMIQARLDQLLIRALRLATAQAPENAAWRYLDPVVARLEPGPTPWPTVAQMAAWAGVSRSRLHQLFRARYQLSPGAYAMQCRLRRVAVQLRGGDVSVTDLALRHGFCSSQHLATAFRRHYGLSPSAYRRREMP